MWLRLLSGETCLLSSCPSARADRANTSTPASQATHGSNSRRDVARAAASAKVWAGQCAASSECEVPALVVDLHWPPRQQSRFPLRSHASDLHLKTVLAPRGRSKEEPVTYTFLFSCSVRVPLVPLPRSRRRCHRSPGKTQDTEGTQ